MQRIVSIYDTGYTDRYMVIPEAGRKREGKRI